MKATQLVKRKVVRDRTSMSEFSDVLLVKDIMEYLRIGRDSALKLFREPDFESLDIGTQKKMITKQNFLKYLETHATLI